MAKKKWTAAVFLLTLALLTGCASIMSQSQWPVNLTSTPSEARITITDDHGKEIFKGATPTIVTLPSGSAYFERAKYSVRFEKEGFEATTLQLTSEMNRWYLGNLVFGGLMGFIVIDPMTGAMWALPATLHGNLGERKTSLIMGDRELTIVLLQDVPVELHDQLIPVS
jgi:hypothetical protein